MVTSVAIMPRAVRNSVLEKRGTWARLRAWDGDIGRNLPEISDNLAEPPQSSLANDGASSREMRRKSSSLPQLAITLVATSADVTGL